MAATNDQEESFFAWLLTQKGRDDAVGDLAHAVAADRYLPRTGSPDELRDFLKAKRADRSWLSAVDEAETDWKAH